MMKAGGMQHVHNVLEWHVQQMTPIFNVFDQNSNWYTSNLLEDTNKIL